jgi:hypothetical protein
MLNKKMVTPARRQKPSFSPRRIYLQQYEVLHRDCPTCAAVTRAIRLDRAQRRVIPEQALEPAGFLAHLEREVLGRPVDFGNPACFENVPLDIWYGGDR